MDNKQGNSPRTKGKRVALFLAAALLLVLALVVVNGISICRYSTVDETTKADTAIVLGAAVANDEPSAVFCERINHGIWLYENGYVDSLIFTGGASDGNTTSDAVVAKNYALQAGLPEEALYVEELSTITQENLYYAKEAMGEQGFKTALIVSDPLHMKRAMLLAGDLDIDAYSSPTKTSRYETWKTKSGFLARELYFYIGYKIYRLF